MFGYEFYVDPSRCIGCQSCLKACEECETHRGVSMINFDYLDRPYSIASAAFVCFHCDAPTCAEVCSADAIKVGEDGAVCRSTRRCHFRRSISRLWKNLFVARLDKQTEIGKRR